MYLTPCRLARHRASVERSSQTLNYHIFLTVNGDLSCSDQVCLVPDQDEGQAAGDAALPEFVQDDLGVLQTGTVSEAEDHHNALILPSRVRVLGQVRSGQSSELFSRSIIPSVQYSVTVSQSHSVTVSQYHSVTHHTYHFFRLQFCKH